MRFCEQCGPLGWEEGHNAGCHILRTRKYPKRGQDYGDMDRVRVRPTLGMLPVSPRY